ncbi:hypothetical protein CBL_13036 [Carabus blaptoides fortunei]
MAVNVHSDKLKTFYITNEIFIEAGNKGRKTLFIHVEHNLFSFTEFDEDTRLFWSCDDDIERVCMTSSQSGSFVTTAGAVLNLVHGRLVVQYTPRRHRSIVAGLCIFYYALSMFSQTCAHPVLVGFQSHITPRSPPAITSPCSKLFPPLIFPRTIMTMLAGHW